MCNAGLYGKLVPQTVANFCKAIESGLYTGTLWSKVLPGEYIQAGQQGSRRTGAVDFQKPAQVLSQNQELLSSKSFRSAVHMHGELHATVPAHSNRLPQGRHASVAVSSIMQSCAMA